MPAIKIIDLLNTKYPHAGGSTPFINILGQDLSWDEQLIQIKGAYNVSLNGAAKWIAKHKKEDKESNNES